MKQTGSPGCHPPQAEPHTAAVKTQAPIVQLGPVGTMDACLLPEHDTISLLIAHPSSLGPGSPATCLRGLGETPCWPCLGEQL